MAGKQEKKKKKVYTKFQTQVMKIFWKRSKLGGLCSLRIQRGGTSLVVQWLRLHASNAGGEGSIPGLGTEIPHALGCGHKIKLKKKESREET